MSILPNEQVKNKNANHNDSRVLTYFSLFFHPFKMPAEIFTKGSADGIPPQSDTTNVPSLEKTEAIQAEEQVIQGKLGKLKSWISKGVSCVRAGVTNSKNYLKVTPEEYRAGIQELKGNMKLFLEDMKDVPVIMGEIAENRAILGTLGLVMVPGVLSAAQNSHNAYGGDLSYNMPHGSYVQTAGGIPIVTTPDNYNIQKQEAEAGREIVFKEVKKDLPEGGLVEVGEMVKTAVISISSEAIELGGDTVAVEVEMDALAFARFEDDIIARVTVGDVTWNLTLEYNNGAYHLLNVESNNKNNDLTLAEKDLEDVFNFDVESPYEVMEAIAGFLEGEGYSVNQENQKAAMKALTGQWQTTADSLANTYVAHGGNQPLSTPDGSSVLGLVNLTNEINTASVQDCTDIAAATGISGLTFDSNTSAFLYGSHSFEVESVLNAPLPSPEEVANWAYDQYGFDTRDAIAHPYEWLGYDEDLDGYPYRGIVIPRDDGSPNQGNLRPQSEIEADIAAQDEVINTSRNAEMNTFLANLVGTGSHFYLSADNYDPVSGELSYRGQAISRDKAPSSMVDEMKTQQEIADELAAIDTNIDAGWDATMATWADAINADAEYGEVMSVSFVSGPTQSDRYLTVFSPIDGHELVRLNRDNADGVPVVTEGERDIWAAQSYAEVDQNIRDWAANMLDTLYGLGFESDPANDNSIDWNDDDRVFVYRDARGYVPSGPSDPYYSDHYTSWKKPGVTPYQAVPFNEFTNKRQTIENRIDNAGVTAENIILAHPSVPSMPDCDFDAVGFDTATNNMFFVDNASQPHVWPFETFHQLPGLENPQINAAALYAIDQVIAENRDVALNRIANEFPENVIPATGFSPDDSNLRFAVGGEGDENYSFLTVNDLQFFLENAESVKEWAQIILLATDPWGDWEGDSFPNQLEANVGGDPFINEQAKTKNKTSGFDPTPLSTNGIVSLIEYLRNSPNVTLDETTKNDWLTALQAELDSRGNNRRVSSEGFRINYEDTDQISSILTAWNNLTQDELAQRSIEWKGMKGYLDQLDKINSSYHLGLREELSAKLQALMK